MRTTFSALFFSWSKIVQFLLQHGGVMLITVASQCEAFGAFLRTVNMFLPYPHGQTGSVETQRRFLVWLCDKILCCWGCNLPSLKDSDDRFQHQLQLWVRNGYRRLLNKQVISLKEKSLYLPWVETPGSQCWVLNMIFKEWAAEFTNYRKWQIFQGSFLFIYLFIFFKFTQCMRTLLN